jgi:hypothetical protein
MRAELQPPARSSESSDMKYPNEEYRAREARAKKAVGHLLTQCNWRVLDPLPFLPPVFREAINVRGADLVLIASGGDHPFGLHEAMREVPLDVLIIEPAKTMENQPTFAATLLRRRKGRIRTTPGLHFWFDALGACFLLPDPHGDDPAGPCYALGENGLREVETPWRNEIVRGLGFVHADAVLLKP